MDTEKPDTSPLQTVEQTRVQPQPTAIVAAIESTSLTAAYVPRSSPSSSFAGNLRDLNTLLEQSQLPDGPNIVEGYKLVHPIGQGGFGCVWEATDLKTEERVAIKFLVRENRDTGTILDEVKYLASVQGQAGVVQVKGLKEDGVPPLHVPYYVMQYAANGSLQDLLKKGALTPRDAVRYFHAIVFTMKFIHERQIIHSDLKLGNILLNEAGEPLIADFGQAQRHNQSSGQGTLFYMAPERATDEKLRPDPRWDVYSLGAMLFTMLVGKQPRQTGALLDGLKGPLSYSDRLAMYRQGLQHAPRPTEHRKFCDPDLARIVDRCLAIDPAERPANAGEVLGMLERRRYLRRMKPLVRLGAASTIGLLLFVGLMSYFIGSHHIEKERAGITKGIERALQKTSGLGMEIIQEKLADRINFVEYSVNTTARCGDEFRLKLEKIGEAIARMPADGADPQARIPKKYQEKCDEWLEGVYADLARQQPKSTKTLALHVVVPTLDPHTNDFDKARNRGYVLSKMTGDAEAEKPITPREDREKNPQLYSKNLSFRDYFNGQDNFGRERTVYRPVIGHTHISRLYQSIAKGKNDIVRWRIDVVTPIWSEAGSDGQPGTGRVIGLLICGIDVDDDIRRVIQSQRSSPAADGDQETVEAEYVILNDRMHWVLHDQYRDRLLEGPAQGRDADAYDELRPALTSPLEAGTVTADMLYEPARVNPPKQRSLKITHTDKYVDLVKWKHDGSPTYEVASFAELKPFRNSIYGNLREKSWTFIAQIDRQKSLGRVDSIRSQVLIGASIVIGSLLAVVLFLWVWLIRLVNRGEFAAHG